MRELCRRNTVPKHVALVLADDIWGQFCHSGRGRVRGQREWVLQGQLKLQL